MVNGTCVVGLNGGLNVDRLERFVKDASIRLGGHFRQRGSRLLCI